MRYQSTRGGVTPITFSDSVMMGLAEDGGLLIPERIPHIGDRLAQWSQLSYIELAQRLLRLYVDDLDDLERLIERAYRPENYQGEVAPVTRLGDLHLLELFHGPTLAFKDVALQLLGNLFEEILARRGGHLNILAATSGDTGSAAIYGVRGRRDIRIFVMHPAGRVSNLQERQMTSVLDDNVFNLRIEGSFDDCQKIMKDLAGDLEFKRSQQLGAVNSVNWARVLAQMTYYVYAYFQVAAEPGRSSVRFAVPTGNFGDILAGYYAWRMGVPISGLVLATNANDILARFFQTGEYSRGPVYHTLAPAMDIQVASNFERYLFYRLGEDPARVRAAMQDFAAQGSLRLEGTDPLFTGFACTEEQLLATIRSVHERYGRLIDPHTATGVAAAEQAGPGDPIICVSTAHPAKFPEAIAQAIGQDLARHPRLEALRDLPTRCETLPARAEAVREFLETAVARV